MATTYIDTGDVKVTVLTVGALTRWRFCGLANASGSAILRVPAIAARLLTAVVAPAGRVTSSTTQSIYMYDDLGCDQLLGKLSGLSVSPSPAHRVILAEDVISGVESRQITIMGPLTFRFANSNNEALSFEFDLIGEKLG